MRSKIAIGVVGAFGVALSAGWYECGAALCHLPFLTTT